MITRELPLAEHDRLMGTPLEAAMGVPNTRILVVEDAGELVGCCMAYIPLHVEGLWIAPSHRKKSAVGRQLLKAVRALAAQSGVRAILAATSDELCTMWKRRLRFSALPACSRLDLWEK